MLKNNRIIVRKLRQRLRNAEKELKKLVGFKAIKLCKSENRMNVALQSLVDIFEAENDKNSENNSTNDLLMMFNKYF